MLQLPTWGVVTMGIPKDTCKESSALDSFQAVSTTQEQSAYAGEWDDGARERQGAVMT